MTHCTDYPYPECTSPQPHRAPRELGLWHPHGAPTGAVISKIRQSINVPDLTGIAHVPPMRALGPLMPQVRHRNVGAIAFKESINPKPALLAAR